MSDGTPPRDLPPPHTTVSQPAVPEFTLNTKAQRTLRATAEVQVKMEPQSAGAKTDLAAPKIKEEHEDDIAWPKIKIEAKDSSDEEREQCPEYTEALRRWSPRYDGPDQRCKRENEHDQDHNERRGYRNQHGQDYHEHPDFKVELPAPAATFTTSHALPQVPPQPNIGQPNGNKHLAPQVPHTQRQDEHHHQKRPANRRSKRRQYTRAQLRAQNLPVQEYKFGNITTRFYGGGIHAHHYHHYGEDGVHTNNFYFRIDDNGPNGTYGTNNGVHGSNGPHGVNGFSGSNGPFSANGPFGANGPFSANGPFA